MTVLWVPGHAGGNEGNNKVDELARHALETTFVGPDLRFGLPESAKVGNQAGLEEAHESFRHGISWK